MRSRTHRRPHTAYRWTACSSSTSRGPDVARRRGGGAARSARAADRPHRHARSAGDRRAAAGLRPGHAPGARSSRRRTRTTKRRSGSASRPTPTTSPASRRRARTRADARGRSRRRSSRCAASYLQMPPAFSAKKVGGQRAYELARRNEPVELRAGAGHGDRDADVLSSGDRIERASR